MSTTEEWISAVRCDMMGYTAMEKNPVLRILFSVV